jgi:hypothetical protein
LNLETLKLLRAFKRYELGIEVIADYQAVYVLGLQARVALSIGSVCWRAALSDRMTAKVFEG